MALKIIKSGLSTSVQDLGRPGYFHLGIPISGAMDRYALRAANMLVGNPEDAAGLEGVLMGPEIEFTEDATVAVTGADMPMTVDGEKTLRFLVALPLILISVAVQHIPSVHWVVLRVAQLLRVISFLLVAEAFEQLANQYQTICVSSRATPLSYGFCQVSIGTG